MSSSTTAPTRDLDAALQDADAAVAALADNFLGWIAADIDRGKDLVDRATASAGDNVADLEAIYDIAHNIKGQGGSFGYDLLTEIGGSLCAYLQNRELGANERQLRIVGAHFAALGFIVEKNVRGDGGDIGRQLTTKLETLIGNVPAPAPA